MSLPGGLHVVNRAPSGAGCFPGAPARPDGAGPAVVLVHGSLDRAESFRRVARRLEDVAVVTYDRRGYQRSRHAGPVIGLEDHVADLLAIVGSVSSASGGTAPAVVGHSLGGDVVIAAALARPECFWAIGAYEPPMPWLSLTGPEGGGPAGNTPRWAPLDDEDPGGEVERFFRRMVGDAAWERLPEHGRSQRRQDASALIADLRSLRGAAPFSAASLAVPAVFGRGGALSSPRHRQTVAWLAEHVPGATMVEFPAAGHGAHLSHPDAFAGLVRAVLRAGAHSRAETLSG